MSAKRSSKPTTTTETTPTKRHLVSKPFTTLDSTHFSSVVCLNVLAHVDYNQKMQCRSVCVKWRELIAETLSELFLTVSPKSTLPRNTFPALTTLVVSYARTPLRMQIWAMNNKLKTFVQRHTKTLTEFIVEEVDTMLTPPGGLLDVDPSGDDEYVLRDALTTVIPELRSLKTLWVPLVDFPTCTLIQSNTLRQFSMLEKLTGMYIQDNDFPEAFKELKNLKHLELSVTEKSDPVKLSFVLNHLKKLEYFELYSLLCPDGVKLDENNKLDLPNLKHLSIDLRSLESLDKTIDNLNGLQALVMYGAELENDPTYPEVLAKMTNLEFMDLCPVHILRDWKSGTFVVPVTLNLASIAHLRIKTLEIYGYSTDNVDLAPLSNTPSLKKLALKHCNQSTINLDKVASLQTVKLSAETIPPANLASLPALTTLDVKTGSEHSSEWVKVFTSLSDHPTLTSLRFEQVLYDPVTESDWKQSDYNSLLSLTNLTELKIVVRKISFY